VRDDEIAKSILAYLSEHPHATDTAEGIVNWWILRQPIRANVAAVTRALRSRTEKGLLEELVDAGQRRYRLKREDSR